MHERLRLCMRQRITFIIMWTNAQKLAAVVTEWARPAVLQIASGKLTQLPMFNSLQGVMMSSGLVGQGYSLAEDIKPLMRPVVDALIEPTLAQYMGNIPDEAIPQVARNIVDKIKADGGTLSVFDGLLTFEEADITELDELLQKNLPIEAADRYTVIH